MAAQEEELVSLKQQARHFRKALNDINQRIDDLQKEADSERGKEEQTA
jgi:hypothetical protein